MRIPRAMSARNPRNILRPAPSAAVGVHPLAEPGAGVSPRRIGGAGRDAQDCGRLVAASLLGLPAVGGLDEDAPDRLGRGRLNRSADPRRPTGCRPGGRGQSAGASSPTARARASGRRGGGTRRRLGGSSRAAAAAIGARERVRPHGIPCGRPIDVLVGTRWGFVRVALQAGVESTLLGVFAASTAVPRHNDRHAAPSCGGEPITTNPTEVLTRRRMLLVAALFSVTAPAMGRATDADTSRSLPGSRNGSTTLTSRVTRRSWKASWPMTGCSSPPAVGGSASPVS
jgi:hypothetical protein